MNKLDPESPDLICPPAAVIKLFGSARRVAREINAIGTPSGAPVHTSTVGRWLKSGRIPERWHPAIVQAAAARGCNLSRADLLVGMDAQRLRVNHLDAGEEI